ncbi:YCF3-INTERACTING PROTEIN 1 CHLOROPLASTIC [Salix koriyanagi]|uniref:YCF3-INTERACTING PROTEIN 1 CHLOROPLASTIC n=1 Tax=Salix koriyanagi TaxID=2511006 RepID=A0A9Q0PVI0_9ROSI|nr:YCF3-INTERACTING PROTEIN 1 CHLOROPLASTIC [Salix koriyanagi]
MAIEESKQLVRKESMRKENQISVDPVSLRESSRGEASFNFMLPPVSTAPAPDLLPPAMPAKSQLIAGSLPSSACSSPRFSFTMLKKKSKNESQASRFQIDNLVGRHSLAHPPLASQQETHMRRSKSCGEGRTAAPAEELNLWFPRPNAGKSDDGPHGHFKTEARKDNMAGANMDPIDDRFKCGALCLYLPGFAKGKPVRPKKEARGDLGNVISRTVSVERFECGSWASSAIINDYEDDFKTLFFDLPLEFIQTSANDANSPVAAAFVFDKDRKRVLKSCSTRAEPRKSYEFSRHVRFSTSSPTSHPTSPTSCITPRLLKAREEFNVFLEAQSA